MRRCKLIILTILFIVLATNIMANPNSFTIYLVADTIPVDQVLEKKLDNIKLQAKPILTIDDVITYSKNTHEIRLRPAAYNRIMQLEAATPFIVCVGNERIYAGAIWSDLYSSGFNGVVISKPLRDTHNILTLQLGYPSSQYFKGVDPRSDPRIFNELKHANKLLNE